MKMKRLPNWLSENMPRWYVIVLLLIVAVLVEYDNNPAVLEQVTKECNHAQNTTEPDIKTGLAERYVKEWKTWRRLDVQLAERIISAADSQRVPHHIAFALVAVESAFDSTAISGAKAIGLTQVRLPTARIYDPDVVVSDLQGVDKNLNIGFRYYHDLLHRYDGDVMLALAAYNMGPTRVDRLNGEVTMKYPDKVLGR